MEDRTMSSRSSGSNPAEALFPDDVCIHHLFAKQALKHPEAVAVVFEDERITYRELNEKSNQLARHLFNIGINHGAPAGLFLERSVEVITGVFGILKAGGAYVPLDPAYPKERLRHMIEDTRSPVILTQSRLKDLLPESKADVICLDTDWDRISGENTEDPESDAEPDSLAYVIYTSGSTGTPKGVCCHHKGVLNLLTDFRNRQPLRVGDICTWWTSLNFDVSVYEIFSPLIEGATLIIVPESVRPDAPALMDWLHKERATSTYLPPFMVADFDVWVREHPGKSMLRRLLVGVEAIAERLLNSIDKDVAGLHIINGYGPTEATVCATLYSIRPENELHENTPIGRPVRNMEIYLLDEEGKKLRAGEPGELCIGGVGVAHGYLNRPDLTAERFIPDTFSDRDGAKLYKTGDVARLMPDGNIEFVGRVDFQVKFHGYRVELGEIETRLRKHPAIREAVVLLREDIAGVKRLVAYLVCYEGQEVSAEELGKRLKTSLPDYMVPSVFVLLDRIPMTPNGKTDRSALPPPIVSDVIQLRQADYKAPETPEEKSIADIFEQLLQLDLVGVNDNFFELGGHSLLATQLCSQMDKSWGVRLPLQAVYDGPTVSELARAIQKAKQKATTKGYPEILPASRERRKFPVSYPQQGMWFMHQFDPSGVLCNIPLVVKIEGDLRVELLREAINRLIRRHEILRTTFSVGGQDVLQIISRELTIDMPVADLSDLPAQEREKELKRLSREEGRYLFDLADGPLLKAVLVCLRECDYRMIFTIHHIVMDGWAASVFFRELGLLYDAMKDNKPSPLTHPVIQYADFSVWQRQWLESGAAQAQLAYWKEKLNGPREYLKLPVRGPRPAVQRHDGSRYYFTISHSLTDALNRLSKQEKVSLYMLLLAAYQTLLHQYSGQDDIIAGSPIANRNHPQVEEIIGIFINALAMRTDFSGDPQFREILHQVRNTALHAYENQDIPFEVVADALGTKSGTDRNPIFQTSFILQNTPPPFIRSADIRISYDEVGNNTAKLDLLLNLEERNGCLEGWFEYNTDLFDEKIMEEMAGHFSNTLNAVVSDTSQRISRLPKPPVERYQEVPGVEESYPLSPMQQGMLFDSLSAREPGVDVEQIIIRCREDLDPSALKDAWEKIVRLHPVMRTSFRWEGLDEPLQDVHGLVAIPWDLQDWRDLTVEEQDTRLKAYLAADRQLGFAMTEPPLMRFALFHVGDAEHQLIWTFHHSLLDGRAFFIVLKEVFGLYDAACEGREAQIPWVRPYRDYIEWLKQQDKSGSEPFWRDTLKGFTSPTQMRIEAESDQAPVEGERHGEEEIRLSGSLTSSLKAGADQYGVTVNTLVQGAWALLLSRYSGEEDVVYGATRACRHWAAEGTENMVGIFINTIPVRVRMPSDAKVGPWLQELRNQHIAVREHEHIPLIDICGWSEVPRGVPLFETLVVFENFLLSSALKAHGSAWANRDLTLLEQTGFPLTLSGYLESELLLRIEYDRARYVKSSISRMLTHLRTLLEAMVDEPERTLASIPVLTTQERDQILIEWNATEAEYPTSKCIHHLFETQVEQTPQRTAVVHDGEQLNYQELNQRANQLAHYLIGVGVEHDMPAGLFVERSLDMAVGVLGILKAGGAYLPLDPSYPKDRLAFMLNDSKAPVIVTQKHVAESLPEHKARAVIIDADWDLISKQSEGNPSVESSASNLAYVMYTSGSTGQPKGVLVPHRGVVNHSVAVTDQYEIQPDDRVLQFFSINFDGSVEELFPAWSSGAAVILRSEEMLASTANFLQWIERERITVIDLPTAYWHELVNGLALSGASLPEAVRVVIVGGEKASMSAYKTWAEISGGRVRWFNTYGPTESTVVSTIYEPDASFEYSATDLDLPIGRPIANTRIYVLDKSLQPLPIGVPGEMLIGGAGVVRGYLNRPELTAKRFIKDPFSDRPGDRLYKTGDLVRYLADGNIEFMGRTDFQLKFRGFRVEPGEIERVIEQHPSVREAVVMLREDVPGKKFLAAYWTAKDGTSPSEAEPRGLVKNKLPEYMVPSAFVLMDTFPLTPNGKVDRRALPVPEATGVESDEPYVAPRNQTEEVLAHIWSEVLGIKRVGIHDNFFELGGHSLLTLQVLDRAHREGFDLTPQQLFKHQTIGELAAVLEPSSAMDQEPVSWSSLVPLQPDGSCLPFFLVHTTPGDILGYGNLVHHLGPDQPCYGFQSFGLHLPEQAHRRIEDMAAYYVDLLLSFQPQGPYILGGWCYGGIVAVEMAQQLVAQGHEIGLLALIDTWAPPPPPDLKYYRYYFDRVGSFLRMGVHRWIRYLRAKIERKIRRRTQSVSDVLAVDLEHGHLANRKHVLNINMQAVLQYRSKPYPGRVTLFNLDDPGDAIVPDQNSGWSTLAAEIESYPISSSHRDILQEPQVKVIAEEIRGCINRVG